MVDRKNIRIAGDYVRYLALTAVERAKSGHPGLPLGCADLGVTLYRYLLSYHPAHGEWANRDRFVLSAGHGSMLLYALLHLSGYNISLEDIRDFRALGSKTPGHPEYDRAIGVETTTGPLGQGIANAVGIALEAKMLAARFNEKDFPLFDYKTYVLMGDGCNMEGVSYEAASLAGHLGLDNLIAIYDSNSITIDGNTNIAFTEDVALRYRALGWDVETMTNDDPETFCKKIVKLKGKKNGKPKFIIARTVIGSGVDRLKNTSAIHGAPAGIDEIVYFIQNSTMREQFERVYGKEIVNDKEMLKAAEIAAMEERMLPLTREEARAFMSETLLEKEARVQQWNELLLRYKTKRPEAYEALMTLLNGPTVSNELYRALIHYKEETSDATRNIAGRILNLCANTLPHLVGGSADLVGSTKTLIQGSPYIQKNNYAGRNIAFGVREHAMGAIANGLALNRAFVPFVSTFFPFFDYMKPPVRLAALMKLKCLFVFSHDSIYVGEDGPTHQPIEHLNALRLIPDLYTFRPANDAETAFSFLYFLNEMNAPAVILGTRQTLSSEAFGDARDREALYRDFSKGAYCFYETAPKTPDIALMASGSEVSLAMESAKALEAKGKTVRVISVPCLELFAQQNEDYQNALTFSWSVPTVFIEAASHRALKFFYRSNVHLVTIEPFGVSAPAKKVAEHLGLSKDIIVANALNALEYNGT